MQQEQRLMDRSLCSAFHLHGWAPSMALTALGPVFGLRGAPRGLAEAAAAAGAVAWIRDQGWGLPKPVATNAR
eukprot:2312277-Alexandrium_andersonii.AAC.1